MAIIHEMLYNIIELSITKIDADRMIGIFNALSAIYQTGHAANF